MVAAGHAAAKVTFGPKERVDCGPVGPERGRRQSAATLRPMVTGERLMLPLHELMAQLHAWPEDRSEAARDRLGVSLERVASAYRAAGAFLSTEMAPIGPLAIGVGSLRALDKAPATDSFTSRTLTIDAVEQATARLWIDGADADDDQLVEAIQLALSATWARHETVVQRQQLVALDAALRGIATIASVEHVLQLIVDRVRELVGARYAALGILGSFGRIDQFIVSGITPEVRALLGPPPEGHGLLGLIIREDRPLLIDDITTDPRRHGFPDHHPDMRSLLGVPVRTRSRTIGNLYLTDKVDAPAFSENDLHLVEKFALHAGIAIENARLHEEVGRLAIVDERQRISQDLHDSVIQSLYAISLSLEDLPEVMAEDSAEGAARTDRAIDAIHAAIRDIRNFIMGLQPGLLEDADLAASLRSLAVEFSGSSVVDLEVHIDEELPGLTQDRPVHVLAIAREALSNIARHSGATRAALKIHTTQQGVRMVISDNGRGFAVGQARTKAQRGLTNLGSRAEAIGGTLSLTSELGAGSRLELNIPFEREEQ